MLFSLSHPWTRAQRRFLLVAGLLACVLVAGLIYTYERYYRGPDESALYGTWLDPMTMDAQDLFYIEFRPDQKFWVVVVISGKTTPLVEGNWYAGGQNIYMRYPAEFSGPSRPTVMHIVDISPEDIAVRFDRDGRVYHYKRAYLDPPDASNLSLQATAGGSDA
jgi:hypothetical protein